MTAITLHPGMVVTLGGPLLYKFHNFDKTGAVLLEEIEASSKKIPDSITLFQVAFECVRPLWLQPGEHIKYGPNERLLVVRDIIQILDSQKKSQHYAVIADIGGKGMKIRLSKISKVQISFCYNL